MLVTETDTIHAYLLLVYNELHTFVEHVANFLTDVFQQTETPLGVQVNKVIVTTTVAVTTTVVTVPPPPVGGYVASVDKQAVLSPWLAVIGVVACIGTVALVTKKRRR